MGAIYVFIFVTKMYMIQKNEEIKRKIKKVGIRERELERICIKRKERVCDTQKTLSYVGRGSVKLSCQTETC